MLLGDKWQTHAGYVIAAYNFAGYVAIKAPAHNTAWIFRASLAAALGASH